jgi:tricarballylate dehydrogenase
MPNEVADVIVVGGGNAAFCAALAAQEQGGLFYFNYPGGSGLMSGTVFGKIAGTSAGRAGKN